MRNSRRDESSVAFLRTPVAELPLFAPPREPPRPLHKRSESAIAARGNPDISGTTYDATLDGPRLRGALKIVLTCLRSGGWWTLRELAQSAQCSEAGASARIRDIRNKLHYVVHAHRRVGGLWEYAMHGAPHADPPRAA